MGRHIRDFRQRWDRIIASPAVRCAETIEIASRDSGRTYPINWDRRIYLASSATLADLLREVLDMLRIAKGHLAKVDATKKLVAKNRVNQIYYAAMRERNEELKRKQAEEALIASAQEQDSQPTAENTEGASKRSWWEKLLGR